MKQSGRRGRRPLQINLSDDPIDNEQTDVSIVGEGFHPLLIKIDTSIRARTETRPYNFINNKANVGDEFHHLLIKIDTSIWAGTETRPYNFINNKSNVGDGVLDVPKIKNKKINQNLLTTFTNYDIIVNCSCMFSRSVLPFSKICIIWKISGNPRKYLHFGIFVYFTYSEEFTEYRVANGIEKNLFMR